MIITTTLHGIDVDFTKEEANLPHNFSIALRLSPKIKDFDDLLSVVDRICRLERSGLAEPGAIV